ncbi:MAG: DEAD/DEAH box helicase family protein [Saprospiraceae bacterium]|nr:DEAD/DEAH box helicase family protein [Saprospiraceae bacterium]
MDTEGVVMTEKRQDIQLRPYQTESLNAIFDAWGRGCRSVMYQSPTGSGKTATIASIVKKFDDNGFRTLTIAHREELVDNIRSEYSDMFGIATGAIKAGQKRDYSLPHQVASIATYVNALDFFPDLIITDEGHHCIAKTYLTIYAAHPRARLLMVTATPYRLSGLGFTDICDELVLGLSVAQLERMGNLVPARLWATPTFTHDQISKIHIVKGEYSESEMTNLLSETQQIMSVVDTYIEKGEGKQMMLYATSVSHSKKLVEAFEWRGIRAGHVDGKSKDRKSIFQQFVNKEIQVLSNCEIATEGNNIPCIEIVGLARKTKSLSMYLQMVGRASRPWAGKTDYLLFDFVDNYWDHGMPNREHDWHSHFKGITRKERVKKDQGLERQFQIESEQGEIFISNLSKLPDGFRGRILQEVDPLDTKHMQMLLKQQAKLEEKNRKLREKQEAIERKKAEVQRRKEEKLAAIQRAKDEKLAEIQRKKDAKEAARLRRIAEIEARKQRKIDEKEAKERKKEEDRLAKIREQERREASWERSRLIYKIQWETKSRRTVESREMSKSHMDAYYRRREESNAMWAKMRETNYSFWEEYTKQSEMHRQEEKALKVEEKALLHFHRMENQFEIGIRMTHSIKHTLDRVCGFCAQKNYPIPTTEQLLKIADPYFEIQGLFTRQKFNDVWSDIAKTFGIKLPIHDLATAEEVL